MLCGSLLSRAVAAVLAYRAFQLGVPAVLGAFAFVQLRRTLNQSRSPAAAGEPLADELPTVTLPKRAEAR